ncbi:hypothetical protein [Flaviaesturariibacter amylovorans]|uniref:DUF4386 domain-containing protein n=1 Tax=Flaviaesturariibacter amylovorans TaxID=1084520 RepID=A0ABP8HTA0_9BACT
MESTYQTRDVLQNELPPARPRSLNILTILTFIGCGLGYLGALLGMVFTKDYNTQRREMEDALDKMGSSGFGRGMIESQLESLEKNRTYFENAYEHRYIIFGSLLVFTTMCLIGAIRMRQLRRSGFPIYTIGELAPIAVTIALLGFSGDGTWKTYMGYIIPIVFVALYAAQRKYLTRD